jgi:sterol desaturase/sphingolipid hydroxylase (fatty acid hydroxylase superfamily)
MSETIDAQVLKRPGDWKPPNALKAPPVFVWPPRPIGFLKFVFGFPGYLWPWNTLFLTIAFLTWRFLTPDLATMKNFSAGWVGIILLRNLFLIVLITSAWHLRLYVQKAQGTEFKYNGRWLATDNPNFLFRNQTADNIFWTAVSGVPIWTGYEVLMLWAQANDFAPIVSWSAHPIYCALLFLAIPVFHETHFYLIHRSIHWPPLYRAVHSLHHRNVNPGPWSGLAMHPVEHLLYFSGALVFWIVPSSPLHIIYFLQNAAFTPSKGHSGFGRVKLKDGTTFDNDHYTHYLHHKYFEVNYGGDGVVPLDKWFGSFHDGTDAAQEAMNKRVLNRRRSASGQK